MDRLLNYKPDNESSKLLLEQYKLYVEMADRISQRRGTANTFYISINAVILTFTSWSAEKFGNLIWLISLVGILLCISWFFTIRSYQQLNSGKFRVIHEIEKELPLNLFSYEWSMLKEGRSFNSYWSLSRLECIVPFVFLVFYVISWILICENGGA